MSEFTEDIYVDIYELQPLLAGRVVPVEEIVPALDRAKNIIETVSGVIFVAEFRSKYLMRSDAYWIKQATSFQTIWMIEHPEAMSATAVASLSQDGLSVDAPDEMTFVLAPLAKRALANCSWMKNSTIQVTGKTAAKDGSILTSDNHKWSPIGSA